MNRILYIAVFLLTAFSSCAKDTTVRVTGRIKMPGYVAPALTLSSAFQPSAGTLIIDHSAGTWASNQIVESSFFYDNATSNVKIYYTGSSDSSAPSFNNRLGISTSSDMVTFTANAGNPLIGQGRGGAPSNRRAHSSWVGKLGSTYYALATNGYGYNYSGEDANTYGYSSTDGITWTDRGLKVNKLGAAGSSGQGNIGVVTDQYNTPVLINGKYVGLIDQHLGSIWASYRMEADSLMGTWTITNQLTTLQKFSGAMYGGAQCIYVNGVYHAFYHYGTGVNANLPTWLAYATSTDCITWTIREAPFKTILATPYPNTDQVADPFICEINGKVYLMAEYVQNAPQYKGQLRLWSYDGTFLQLLNAL